MIRLIFVILTILFILCYTLVVKSSAKVMSKYVRIVKIFLSVANASEKDLSVAAYEQIYRYIAERKMAPYLPFIGHLISMRKRVVTMFAIARQEVDEQSYSELMVEVCKDFTYEERMEVMTMLFVIASVDSCINTKESALIDRYVRHAGIYYGDYMSIKRRYSSFFDSEKKQGQKENKKAEQKDANRRREERRQRSQSRKGQQQNKKQEQKKEQPKKSVDVNAQWAYAVLGLPKNASEEMVKGAYRKLSMQYHPDRHEGESEERIEFYTEKFMHINEAYELLTR